MKMQKIIMADGEKSALCSSICPTIILTDTDEVVIQGYFLSDAESKPFKASDGEGFVKMPRSVFDKIVSQID